MNFFRLGAYGLPLLAALVVWNFPQSALAAEEAAIAPWQIEADRLVRLVDPDRVIAEGNVVLSKIGGSNFLSVRADWIQFEVESARVFARGNLLIITDGEEIKAQEARIDLNRQTGGMTDVSLFVADSNLRFLGQQVEKTGEMSYHFRDGWITSCPVGPQEIPPWSIQSKDVYVKMEGYAELWHAYLNIRNIPVLYTPYFILPTFTRRKTGFLFPELSQSSRNGTGLVTPLFIALNPSRDITLYPGILARRGNTLGVEFRYVADSYSKGFLGINYLSDRTADIPGDDYKEDGYLRTNQDRYWLFGKMNHDFGNSFFLKMDLDYASDRDFLLEYRKNMFGFDRNNKAMLETFSRSIEEISLVSRESSLQVMNNSGQWFWGGEMRLVDASGNDPGSVSQPQTLPRILAMAQLPLAKFAADFEWQSEYVHFSRDVGVSGHRLDLNPRIVVPFPENSWLEGIAVAGIRQRLYLVDQNEDPDFDRRNEGSLSKASGQFSLDGSFSRQRTYADVLGREAGLTHLVRPYFRYNYDTDADQRDLPYFDLTDRMEPLNFITYGVKNYFTSDLALSGAERPGGHTLGSFMISQAFDFKGGRLNPLEQKKEPFSSILLEVGFFPATDVFVGYETAVNLYGEGVVFYDFQASYENKTGNRLELNYRYDRHPGSEEPYFFGIGGEESSHEIDLALEAKLSPELTLRGDLSQSLSNDRTVDGSLKVLYQPSCWTMEISASKTPDDQRMALIFSLSGLGKILELGLDQL